MQPKFLSRIGFVFLILLRLFPSHAQGDLPQDYLSKDFHKGRREAARALMPEHSILVVFAYPVRNFSNDMDYFFHQNPDLYYFTGYKEPNAVLFLFKEEQLNKDGQPYNEIFFVQGKDPRQEQWTGRRLGTNGAQEQSGIQEVYEGSQFKEYPLDFSTFNKIIYRFPADLTDDKAYDKSELFDLINDFKKKAQIPEREEQDFLNDLTNFSAVRQVN